MIVVGGKIFLNIKQFLSIVKQYCEDSYLVEDENELELVWFKGKKLCGIIVGVFMLDWIIENVK